VVRTRWARSRSPSRKAMLDEDLQALESRLPQLREKSQRYKKKGPSRRRLTVCEEIAYEERIPEFIDDDILKRGELGTLRQYKWKRTHGKPVDVKGRSRKDGTIVGLL